MSNANNHLEEPSVRAANEAWSTVGGNQSPVTTRDDGSNTIHPDGPPDVGTQEKEPAKPQPTPNSPSEASAPANHNAVTVPKPDIVATAAATIHDDDVSMDDTDVGDFGGVAGLWQPDSPARVEEHILDLILHNAQSRNIWEWSTDDLSNKCIKQGFRPDQIMTCITNCCLLYTSPSPRDRQKSRMPSSA